MIAQTAELKSIHKKRKTTQERIIAAEAAVTSPSTGSLRGNKMLEYLSNAQGAMQNLYQIKRAGAGADRNPEKLRPAENRCRDTSKARR